MKSGYDLYKLILKDILYIESDAEYVLFHTKTEKIMSYQSLKSLEKTLDSELFMRVNRSYIINRTKVRNLKGRDLTIENKLIPVSDTYFDRVKSNLF